jgi:hypothetical protein
LGGGKAGHGRGPGFLLVDLANLIRVLDTRREVPVELQFDLLVFSAYNQSCLTR